MSDNIQSIKLLYYWKQMNAIRLVFVASIIEF